MLNPLAPVSAVTGRSEAGGLELRQNQIVAAQVLRVSADHVVLALQGVRVVARLTEAEQADWLDLQRSAFFQVQGMDGHELVLRALRPQTTAAPVVPPPMSEMVARLLQQAGAAPTPSNQQLAQALLRHGLTVSTNTLAELQHALGGAGPWTPNQVDLAAAMRAAGLPQTPEALTLAQGQPVDVLQTLPALRREIAHLIGQPLPPALAEAASKALATLTQTHIDWSAPPAQLAEQLEAATRWLLEPLERELAHAAANPADAPATGLWALARLRSELSRHAGPESHALLAALDRCLEAASLTQLANTAPEAPAADGRWLMVPMALHSGPPASHAAADQAAAHLRVAYQAAGEGASIDLGHTRLRLQIDLEAGEAILVDLSMTGQAMGAHVIVPGEMWQAAAEAELGGLAEGLKHLGFELRSAEVSAGHLTPANWLTLGVPARPPERPAQHAVDLEA